MKHTYTLLLVCVLTAYPGRAQQLPTMNSSDTVYRTCPWDTTQIIQTYAGWEAYQTTNNEWDGPRDSAYCIDLFELSGQFPIPRLRFDQCDLSRSVFVRALLDSASALPLTSNNIYSLYTQPWPSDWAALDTSANCPGGLCTGVMAAVRVPDSLGTSQLLRWHQGGYINPWMGPAIDLCIPTERMPDNALREVIYKYTPTQGAISDYVDFQYIDLVDHAMNQGVEPLTEASILTFNQTQYTYWLWGFGPSYLAMYEDSTYPATAHPSYLDVFPVPNVPAPSNVSVTLDPYANLVFQPFAQIRAGHVLNNDSVFHNLTFINQGVLCMSYNFIEIFWEAGSRYVHAGGDVHLDGTMSCFLFKPGSTLQVASGERFDYGLGGRGMLGLREGMDVVIEPGAELVLHNMVDLKEATGATRPGRLVTTLGIGSKLSFSPSASVHNAYSVDGAMKWYIYLDGGTCDISALSPADQEKIVLVQLPARTAGDLTLGATLVSETVTFSLPVRQDGLADVRIVDASGRTVLSQQVQLVSGKNTVEVPIHLVRSGAYVLDVHFSDERRSARFVKG